MEIEQILKVLKTERECIKRQGRPLEEGEQCLKDDAGVKLCELCELCLSDNEILAVYDFLINGYELLQDRNNVEEYVVRFKSNE